MSWQDAATPLVSSAIEAKYGNVSSAMVEGRLAKLSPLIEAAASEAEVRVQLASPVTPEQDISNQLIVVALIEKWWSCHIHPCVGIRDVHRALFGDQAVDEFREVDDVADF